MKITKLIACAVLPLGALSAQGSVFELHPGGGPGGGSGDVVALDALESRPPALQGIVLLPFDCVGRTTLNELLPDQPRRRTDIPGAARLLLPHENGSLYKFRRGSPGQRVFGHFVVRPDGSAASVFELPAIGPTGADDPMPGKIALAPNGKRML